MGLFVLCEKFMHYSSKTYFRNTACFMRALIVVKKRRSVTGKFAPAGVKYILNQTWSFREFINPESRVSKINSKPVQQLFSRADYLNLKKYFNVFKQHIFVSSVFLYKHNNESMEHPLQQVFRKPNKRGQDVSVEVV